MSLRALEAVAQARNGVGAFVLQCKRLEFHYCNHGGSSRGMKSFIERTLPQFARANPQIEIHVSPRPNKHPMIRGAYVNGRNRDICVRNLEKEQILGKAEILKDASGDKVKKIRKPVQSINDSVRGVWSGLHGHRIMLGDEQSRRQQ